MAGRRGVGEGLGRPATWKAAAEAAHLSDRREQHEVALGQLGVERLGLGRVGHAQERPGQRDEGQHDAQEEDRPVGRVPAPGVP